MVSKTAQADIEDMWDAGLKPTFHDIIRLNALALEVERTKAGFSLAELPRVSFLGEAVFREPTIGSEMWLASASRLFDSDDMETFMLLRAFSLSMPQSELPDPIDQKTVLDAIQKFKDSLAFATIPQLMAAVGYAVHGFASDACEKPAERKDDTEKQASLDDCYEIGLLRQGMIYRLGSAAELRDQPPRVLREMVVCAMTRDHQANLRKDMVSKAEDDYLRTLDEITARLKHVSSDKPHESVELDDKDRRDNKNAHEHVKCPIA